MTDWPEGGGTEWDMATLKFDAVLKEWWIISFLYEDSIVGRVYGDRKGRFVDGRWIITSALRTPRKRIVDGKIVQTRNSRYLLIGTTN
jgi:hypothetical protein